MVLETNATKHEEKASSYDTIIEIEAHGLDSIVTQISDSEQCRYPLLALRLFLHIITKIDTRGRVYISARQLAKKLGVHYDTVTKALKYLRQIGLLKQERDN